MLRYFRPNCFRVLPTVSATCFISAIFLVWNFNRWPTGVLISYQQEILPNEEIARTAAASTNDRDFSTPLPQVLTVATMKCGSGAFKNFFKKHPQVERMISSGGFFSSPANTKSYRSTESGKISVEVNPNYNEALSVPKSILDAYTKEKQSTPKFIWLACNPVNRAFSQYSLFKRMNKSKEMMNRYPTFEHYIEDASNRIKEISSKLANPSDLNKLLPHLWNDEVFEFVRKGFYGYILDHWLKTFPIEDFIFVSGEELITNPGNALTKVQKKLDLELAIGPQNFTWNPARGFFCFNSAKRDSEYSCLMQDKGSTRSVINGTVVQSELTERSKMILRDLYKDDTRHFISLAGVGSHWL